MTTNKKLLLGGVAMAMVLMAVTFPAFAQDSNETLGGMMVRIRNSTNILPQLISYLGYLTGFLFAGVGVYKLRQHVEYGPNKVELPEPLKYLFVGGLSMTLPVVAGVAQATFGGIGDAQNVGGAYGARTIGGEAGEGLDGMLLGFMQSIYRPTQILIELFCYVAGAALMLIAVHRFTKTAQQGAQGPTGLGTVATFMLAGVLFSIGPSVGTLTETLFSDRTSSLQVQFMALSQAGGADHAEKVVISVLAFLVIVGILSIVRGFFVLRGVAEGNQQMTMMSGVSHVIAGAILVNFGQFANIIQNTLGIDQYGVLFN